MLNKIIAVPKKKINAFMLFSLSYYGITIVSMFWKEFTEKHVLPILNTLNEFPLIYLVAVIAIGISLYTSHQKTRSIKNSIYGMFWRSSIELQIMLWGTLASLMFNLGMIYSNSTEIHIGVSILAGVMMSLNWERERIVNWCYNKWVLYLQSR